MLLLLQNYNKDMAENNNSEYHRHACLDRNHKSEHQDFKMTLQLKQP